MPHTARIAIIDDDLPVRKALARLLTAHAFTTATYASGAEFITSLVGNSLQGKVPQCMIVDVQMPQMTGIELQQYLTRGGVKIPTVVITAHDEPGLREQCYAAGAEVYLVKPLTETKLLAAVKAAIGIH